MRRDEAWVRFACAALAAGKSMSHEEDWAAQSADLMLEEAEKRGHVPPETVRVEGPYRDASTTESER